MNIAVCKIVISVSFLLMKLLHHWKQILKELQQARACRHDHHRRHDEKEYWEYQLDADFGAALFSVLFSPGPQIPRMRAQGFSHAGSEPVVLHQNSYKPLDLF